MDNLYIYGVQLAIFKAKGVQFLDRMEVGAANALNRQQTEEKLHVCWLQKFSMHKTYKKSIIRCHQLLRLLFYNVYSCYIYAVW
jgi:hypothetical protein